MMTKNTDSSLIKMINLPISRTQLPHLEAHERNFLFPFFSSTLPHQFPGRRSVHTAKRKHYSKSDAREDLLCKATDFVKKHLISLVVIQDGQFKKYQAS